MTQATYFYKRLKQAVPFKVFTDHRIRVEVLETKGSMAKVKFLEFHADGRGPGKVTWVQTKNVR